MRADKIKEIAIGDKVISGTMLDENGQKVSFKTVRVEPDLAKELQGHKLTFRGQVESTFLRTIFSWMIPILLFMGVWYFMMKRMNPGAGALNFGNNKGRIHAEKDIPTRFEDVAGVDEAKEELQEIVQFLKTPERFTVLGGAHAQGRALGGPSRHRQDANLTGRGRRGRSAVFSPSAGSEFVEMFVGVGAARVRELFSQAKEKAPCIIFIDEIDALGKARGVGMMGGHDEREQTLQQLLVEMDGFDPRSGVIIMAATNRPEILDPALMRAGRFDRQVLVDKPDLNGRIAILEVHARRVTLASDVDLKVLAQRTPGLSGADLENILNEGALLAARNERTEVTMDDLNSAIDRIIGGLEKKNRVINQEEKKRVAFHETGHALVAALTPGTDPVHKISIIPRGIAALGYTEQRPTEDRYLMTQSELTARVDVMLGGRVAEKVAFGEVSTGAGNDLQRATDLVRSMLAEYGMGKTLGPVTFPRRNQPVFLPSGSGMSQPGQDFSEHTAAALDEELKSFMNEREQRVIDLLEKHNGLLGKVSEVLLDKESLEGEEFRKLVEAETGPLPPGGVTVGGEPIQHQAGQKD